MKEEKKEKKSVLSPLFSLSLFSSLLLQRAFRGRRKPRKEISDLLPRFMMSCIMLCHAICFNVERFEWMRSISSFIAWFSIRFKNF